MTLPCLPGAGRTPPRVRRATENAGLGGWRKTQSGQGLVRQAAQRACAGRTPLGLALEKGTPCGGWQRTQLGQGVIPGKLLRGRNGGERSPATGYAVRYRPDGNCVATVSVRSAVVADGPERVKPAMPLPVSGNCAAAVWGSGRSLLSARPQGEDREAFQPLRKLDSRERGIRDAVLFLAATSLTMMVRRGVEVPRLG